MERFPIVNKLDVVVRYADSKEDLHAHAAYEYHRSAHVFVETFGGGFVLQKKALGTENGGKWSSAASGHVRLNETYEEAAVRELREEIGISILEKELYFVGKLNPSPETGNEFVALYTYLMDPAKEKLVIDHNEVDEAMICGLKDVVADVKADSGSYSPAFVILLNMFLSTELEGNYVLYQ